MKQTFNLIRFLLISMFLMFVSNLWATTYKDSSNGLTFTYTVGESTCYVSDYNNAYVEVSIPESITIDGRIYEVTSIGYEAFFNCTSLISVSIPQTVTAIGSSAFHLCSKLTLVTIGNNVTTIGDSAFKGCTSLNTISIPNSVTSIGSSAFSGCTKMTSATIGNNVSSIGFRAFYECTSLTSITMPKSVTSIGDEVFEDCSSLASVTISENVTTIESGVFRDCSALKSIIIPKGVTCVGDYAFCGCTSMTTVDLPKTITSIAPYAFNGCKAIAEITCRATQVPPVGSSAFASVPASAVVKVPSESVEAYTSDTNWGGFIIEALPVETVGTFAETDISLYDNIIYAEKSNGFVGKSSTISIRLKHSQKTSGLQANVYFPEEFTISKVTRGEDLKATDESDEYLFNFSHSESADGSRFILCYPNANDILTNEDIEIAKITFDIPEDMTVGNYPITIKNAEIAYNTDGLELEEAVSTFTVDDYIIGDANNDGKISVADITSISAHLHGNTSDAFHEKAADANEDGKVSVADITTLSYLLHNGTTTAAREMMLVPSLVASRAVSSENEVNLTLNDATAKAGTDVSIPVLMTGQASGMQFNVYTPEGITLKTVARGEQIKAEDDSGERIFTFSNSEQADGSRFVLCYSMNVLTEKAGEIVKLTFSVDESLAGGEYEIQIKNIECAHAGEVLNTYTEYTAILTVVSTKETVSVTSLGLATYCPAYPVDFSSAQRIWAYKAAVNGSSVKLTKVSTVAAGEGVLLRALSGGAETEELPIATSTTTAATDNEFVGTLTDKQICQIDGDKTNYVLSAETTGVGFYKAKLEADGGTTVPAGKAYLPVITSLLNDVNSFSIGWEDEATGIVSLKAGYDAGAVYNLQGIRIEQPSKGLYIRNGKKIVIK